MAKKTKNELSLEITTPDSLPSLTVGKVSDDLTIQPIEEPTEEKLDSRITDFTLDRTGNIYFIRGKKIFFLETTGKITEFIDHNLVDPEYLQCLSGALYALDQGQIKRITHLGTEILA